MYTINEFRNSDPIYTLGEGADLDYAKAELVRATEAGLAVERAVHRRRLAAQTRQAVTVGGRWFNALRCAFLKKGRAAVAAR